MEEFAFKIKEKEQIDKRCTDFYLAKTNQRKKSPQNNPFATRKKLDERENFFFKGKSCKKYNSFCPKSSKKSTNKKK